MNTETKLSVPTIVCGGCASGIKKALDKVSGINKVEVNVDTKLVTVEHTEEVSREKLADVLDDAGFPVE
ncbi:MAG: heavy-metal-associated domain-containing protein [Acidobacteria bacterium]|nr:heavy-metal-associated domain-containing protein [Acidobacteriota bacterium]